MEHPGDLDRPRRVRRRRHRPAIAACYQARLADGPDDWVTVDVKFTIQPDGAVTDVAAADVGDPDLEGCLERVIASIRFRGDTSTVHVASYPFRFAPAEP